MTVKNTGISPFSKRGRLSEKLTAEDKKALKAYLKGFDTMQAAADNMGMNRVTLLGISRVGSGSPANINKIRETINVPA
jgi:hypothetical protein